jgi:hypothetical protein
LSGGNESKTAGVYPQSSPPPLLDHVCTPKLVSRAAANASELARENAWSRIYLVPAILAEQDRDEYRRSQAALAREKEIMKDVEGWEVSAAGAQRAAMSYRAVADSRPASRSTTGSGIPPAPLPSSKRQNVFMATAGEKRAGWTTAGRGVATTACGAVLTRGLMVRRMGMVWWLR